MTRGSDTGSALIDFLAGLGHARKRLALARGGFAIRPLLSAIGGARGAGFSPPWATGAPFGIIERETVSVITTAPAVQPARESGAAPATAAPPRSEPPPRARRGDAPSPIVSSAPNTAPVNVSSSEVAAAAATRIPATPALTNPPTRAAVDGRKPIGRILPRGAAPPAARAHIALAGVAPFLAFLPGVRRVQALRVASAGATPSIQFTRQAVALARTLRVEARIDRFFPRESQAVGATNERFFAREATSLPPGAGIQFGPTAPAPNGASIDVHGEVAPGPPAFPQGLARQRPYFDSAQASRAEKRPAARADTPAALDAMENESPRLSGRRADSESLRQIAGIAEGLREKVETELRELRESIGQAQSRTAPRAAPQPNVVVTDDLARRMLKRIRELTREERFRNGELHS
jgi:hypothetical protein